MKNLYNQKWLLVFGISAITLNQWVLYAIPEEEVPDRLRRHEDKHRKQFRRDGVIKFLARYFGEYIWFRLWHWKSHWEAYLNISYEIEAREAE